MTSDDDFTQALLDGLADQVVALERELEDAQEQIARLRSFTEEYVDGDLAGDLW